MKNHSITDILEYSGDHSQQHNKKKKESQWSEMKKQICHYMNLIDTLYVLTFKRNNLDEL